MNAVSLYVSTTSLVFQADPEDLTTYSELFNIIPHLRQSLSCTVCGNLLIEPHTPTESNCQHHVCKSCKGRKKNLKPSCSWCKDYDKYIENIQIRILLQCYKSLCEYLASSAFYRRLVSNIVSGGSTLAELIKEGSGFEDDFKPEGTLAETANSFFPKLYSSTSTQTSGKTDVQTPIEIEFTSSKDSNQIPIGDNLQAVLESGSINLSSSLPLTHNSVYQVDVVYSQLDSNHDQFDKNATEISVVDLPVIELQEKTGEALKARVATSGSRRSRSVARSCKSLRSASKGVVDATATPAVVTPARQGCRCGIATKSAQPGKLTCCGQRCPCYIERRACSDCKCRGCRNPHTLDGQKISYPLASNGLQLNNASLSVLGESSSISANNATVQVVGMCTTPLNVSPNTSGIILDGNSVVTTDHDDDGITMEL
ncbi:E3 ubiquitin-protein ligase MSL2 [Nilaparvata lugens]|uniref:E3 ubiquitin-protein ligase MSL2 n=1 Tax=Nilaparvata lugens TaxID=108931 RepID=UPI000B97D2C2|nr:E3 ubiquitin-protein ligase MSL2 [Nilaparvata lugens]